MIAIIDYGAGNLFSLASSLKHIGADAEVTDDIEKIRKAYRLILPGVGAFGDAAEALRSRGLDEVIREEALAGKPLMGICLGMQLLFERSLEYGEHQGLGLIRGTVRPLEGYLPEGFKIPQIGWNSLDFHDPNGNPESLDGDHAVCRSTGKHPVFNNVPDGAYVYFVHSYYGDADPAQLAATCEYGKTVTAAVASGSVIGCQFHPEKSGDVGMQILQNFCSW
ncbi:MAG: imidazole glycerol phosphate synthase subunit HisH [Eubacterium sp.]|nr:imidazole glycerol phosphate synthase subunit HisH [Eubacterium sp.]